MSVTHLTVRIAAFCAIPLLLAAQSTVDRCASGEAPAVCRQTAAAAMEQSLARQRAAIASQTHQTGHGTFFLLPPPQTMGANTPAPLPPPVASAPACEPLPESEMDSLLTETARREDLDQALLRGVVQQESAFRPCAVSSKGAMGLMQLMPDTARQLDVPNPFDPASNLNAGAHFLKDLLLRYGGDLPRALGAYNAGPARVDAAMGVPDIAETQDYVNRILSSLPVKK